MQTNRYWTLRRVLKYSSPLIRLFEKPLIRKYGEKLPKSHPVFIIGLPRSGSTFVYQLLSDLFDVNYLDNLMNLGRECLYFTAWLSHLIYGDRPHHSYASEFGDTWESGLHAPSEAGPLWYRWIPGDMIYLNENSLDQRQRRSMSRNLYALINRYRKPLLIKNLFFANRIRLIRSVFPLAKFILVERESIYVAQSIYLSRLKNTKDPATEWWSVKFKGYEQLMDKQIVEQVAGQVAALESIIRKDLAEVDPSLVLRISYEKFQEDLQTELMGSFLETGMRKGSSREQVKFRMENRQKVDDFIFERLKESLEYYRNKPLNLQI